MKKISILVAVVLILFCLIIIWFTGYINLPFSHTLFTPNFTFEKIKQVKKGITQKQVRDILGEPYAVIVSDNPYVYGGDNWQYSTTGKKGNFNSGNVRLDNDPTGIRTVGVDFDNNQKVKGIFDGVFNYIPLLYNQRF